MTLQYSLTYAGVPFVSDTAKIIRKGPLGIPPGQVDEQDPIRKQQPEVNLVDEINRIIPFHNLDDFRLPTPYAGRNLGAIAIDSHAGQGRSTPYEVKIGEWYYPAGATRWSVFRGLATSSQVKAMLAATYQPINPTPAQWPEGTLPPRAYAGSIPALLSMTCQPLTPISGLGYTVNSFMYMLPPRPLGETLGAEGLFLITLIDERYYFQYVPATTIDCFPTGSTYTGTWVDWQFIIDRLAFTLGISLTFSPSVLEAPPLGYTGPEIDSPLWSNAENAATLLDAVAYNLGCKVVRNLNGTYTLQRPLDAAAVNATNRDILLTGTQRIAGGNIFDSSAALNTGARTIAVNEVLPNSVNVTFPLYVFTNTPVPHFQNARTIPPQQPSAWYEESYGSVYTLNVPIQEGVVVETGIVGTVSKTGTIDADDPLNPETGIQVAPYVHTIHDTAKALIPNDGSLDVANLLNTGDQPGLIALATQIAADYYAWQAGTALDEVYQGTVAWQPAGGHDVIWTYSERERLASCRVTRTQWNSLVKELQHTTPPALSAGIYTNTPPGVGGPSVAQSWRDAYAAYIQKLTTAPVAVGETFAILDNIDRLPTQNRWKALITGPDCDGLVTTYEVVEFDGTSGGILDDPANPTGYIVTFAQNNINVEAALEEDTGVGIDVENAEANPTPEGLLEAESTDNPDTGDVAEGVYARGIEGTLELCHAAGASVYQLIPNTAYGINVVTFEKGQFVHPADWGAGIRGVEVKPQTQTVMVWSASGQPVLPVLSTLQGSIVQPEPPPGLLIGQSPSPTLEGSIVKIPSELTGSIALGEQQPVGTPPSVGQLIREDNSPNQGQILVNQIPPQGVLLPDLALAQSGGYYYYSGGVFIQNTETGLGYEWVENCWIQERNDNPVVSGKFYDGQLFGYTINPYWTKNALGQPVQETVEGAVAPLYLVNEIPPNPPPPEPIAVVSVTDATTIKQVVLKGPGEYCSVYVHPGISWKPIYDLNAVGCTGVQCPCIWTTSQPCWFLPTQQDPSLVFDQQLNELVGTIPPLNQKVIAKLVGTDSNGIPIYTRDIQNAFVQITSLETQVVTTADLGAIDAYPAVTQMLIKTKDAQGNDTTTWVDIADGFFYPTNLDETPSVKRRYACQVVTIATSAKDNNADVPTHVEVWGSHIDNNAVITVLTAQVTQGLNVLDLGGKEYKANLFQATRWVFINGSWVQDSPCLFMDANGSNFPPLNFALSAKQVATCLDNGFPVYTCETREMSLKITGLKLYDIPLPQQPGGPNNPSTLGYQATNMVFTQVQGFGEYVPFHTCWFIPQGYITPSLYKIYTAQVNGTAADGTPIFTANIDPSAFIRLTDLTQRNVQMVKDPTNPLGGTCTITAYLGTRYAFVGCDLTQGGLQPDGPAWFFREVDAQPPMCSGLYAVQMGVASDGSPIFVSALTTQIVQVIDLTPNRINDCVGGLANQFTVYKCTPIVLLGGKLLSNGGLAWFFSLSGQPPILNGYYACQLLASDSAGIAIWTTHSLINTLSTENILLPNNLVTPTTSILANNDQGNRGFGRIFFQNLLAGSTQLNWQGLIGLHNGGSPTLSWPNIDFEDSNLIQFTVGNDGTAFAVDVAATININNLLTIIDPLIIQYIITNINLLYPAICPIVEECAPGLTAENEFSPLNSVFPVTGIICNNDQGAVRFGRIMERALTDEGPGVIELNWQGQITYHNNFNTPSGPEPDLLFKDTDTIIWTITDSGLGANIISADTKTQSGSYFVVCNTDCTGTTIYGPKQDSGIYAQNTVGGKVDDTHDFGHIIWKQTNVCASTFVPQPGQQIPLGGPGGYFSWQGIRIQGDTGGTVGPGEDIILKGGKCAQGSGPTINVSVKNAGNNVEADFNTVGKTGTIQISYLYDVKINDDCSVTKTYNTLTLFLNCGLIVDANCNNTFAGPCLTLLS